MLSALVCPISAQESVPDTISPMSFSVADYEAEQTGYVITADQELATAIETRGSQDLGTNSIFPGSEYDNALREFETIETNMDSDEIADPIEEFLVSTNADG